MRGMILEGIRDHWTRLQGLESDIEAFARDRVTTDDVGDVMGWFDDALELINTNLDDILLRDEEGLRWAYEALLEAYGMSVMMSIVQAQDLTKRTK